MEFEDIWSHKRQCFFYCPFTSWQITIEIKLQFSFIQGVSNGQLLNTIIVMF